MSNKTRILYTIPNFKTAGSQYVVRSLLERLDKTQYEVFIGVERFPETIPQLVPKENRITFLRTGNWWNDVKSFSKKLKKHHITIVHSWDYKSESIEAMGCKLAQVPYLFTKKNDAWSKRWFLKSVLAKHIAYDNPEMKDRFFSNRLLQNKITFIPHGVDTTLFKPSLEKGDNTETFTLCSVGNINENKNQLFILEALKALPEYVHFNMFGKADEPYLEKLKKQIHKEGLENRVHIKGFVLNEELPHILQEQDVFVLASKREGLPVSILEALACGIPALSSDSGGGARFIFKDTAKENIFSVNDHKDFIKKLMPFIKDTAYYKRKQRESVQIAQQFDVKKEVNAYSKLYKEII